MEDAQPNDGGDKKIVHVYPLVKVFIFNFAILFAISRKNLFLRISVRMDEGGLH